MSASQPTPPRGQVADGRPDVPRDRPDRATTIALRPIASPLPLGFFAFGVGASMTAAMDLGWIPQADRQTVAILLLAFVAPLEGLSGIFAFLARDTGVATTMTTFAATWAATGAAMLGSVEGVSAGVGYFYLSEAAVFVLIALAATAARPMAGVVLVLAAVRFGLSGVWQLTGEPWAQTAGGWAGVALVVAAFYGGLALLLEDTRGRAVLPITRRRDAKLAIEGELEDQIGDLDEAAGVRRML